jgi:hypothetical protein
MPRPAPPAPRDSLGSSFPSVLRAEVRAGSVPARPDVTGEHGEAVGLARRREAARAARGNPYRLRGVRRDHGGTCRDRAPCPLWRHPRLQEFPHQRSRPPRRDRDETAGCKLPAPRRDRYRPIRRSSSSQRRGSKDPAISPRAYDSPGRGATRTRRSVRLAATKGTPSRTREAAGWRLVRPDHHRAVDADRRRPSGTPPVAFDCRTAGRRRDLFVSLTARCAVNSCTRSERTSRAERGS